MDATVEEAGSNAQGRVAVMFSDEEYQFLMQNCENNIKIAYAALNNNLPEEIQNQITDKIDQFKAIQKALKDAKL